MVSTNSLKFYQTFNEQMISIFYMLFQKIAIEETLPNSSYEASIPLISTPDKLQEKKMTDQFIS